MAVSCYRAFSHPTALRSVPSLRELQSTCSRTSICWIDGADLAGRIDHDKKLLDLLLRLKHDLEALGPNPSDDDARRVFANLVEPLMQVSKCPDFIVEPRPLLRHQLCAGRAAAER